MKLTQILLRKRKMITKPQSYVRNWQWNNSWYLNQERRVVNIGMKEALQDRDIPYYTAEDVLSSYLPERPIEPYEEQETQLKAYPKDESHPYWQETPAHTYNDRTWLPRDEDLTFAQAITNSVAIDQLPTRLKKSKESVNVDSNVKERLSILIKSCNTGDSTQNLLPKNFAVPYIGWHPVESRMRPRNLYNHEAMSWGWNKPREYGIHNTRRLANLTRAIHKEVMKNNGLSLVDCQYLENSRVRQFIRTADGKLIRFYLKLPFAVTNGQMADNLGSEGDLKTKIVPDVRPMNPLATLHATNIYQPISNHPILSLNHSHPYITTVVSHYTSHIYPRFFENKERARSILLAFATALGQARLKYGDDVAGDLPEPITINAIATDGGQYTFSTFQLNSMDLSSKSNPNIISYHPDILNLYEFCGFRDAQPVLEGLDMDTFGWLSAFLSDGLAKRTSSGRAANLKN